MSSFNPQNPVSPQIAAPGSLHCQASHQTAAIAHSHQSGQYQNGTSLKDDTTTQRQSYEQNQTPIRDSCVFADEDPFNFDVSQLSQYEDMGNASTTQPAWDQNLANSNIHPEQPHQRPGAGFVGNRLRLHPGNVLQVMQGQSIPVHQTVNFVPQQRIVQQNTTDPSNLQQYQLPGQYELQQQYINRSYLANVPDAVLWQEPRIQQLLQVHQFLWNFKRYWAEVSPQLGNKSRLQQGVEAIELNERYQHSQHAMIQQMGQMREQVKTLMEKIEQLESQKKADLETIQALKCTSNAQLPTPPQAAPAPQVSQPKVEDHTACLVSLQENTPTRPNPEAKPTASKKRRAAQGPDSAGQGLLEACDGEAPSRSARAAKKQRKTPASSKSVAKVHRKAQLARGDRMPGYNDAWTPEQIRRHQENEKNNEKELEAQKHAEFERIFTETHQKNQDDPLVRGIKESFTEGLKTNGLNYETGKLFNPTDEVQNEVLDLFSKGSAATEDPPSIVQHQAASTVSAEAVSSHVEIQQPEELFNSPQDLQQSKPFSSQHVGHIVEVATPDISLEETEQIASRDSSHLDQIIAQIYLARQSGDAAFFDDILAEHDDGDDDDEEGGREKGGEDAVADAENAVGYGGAANENGQTGKDEVNSSVISHNNGNDGEESEEE